MVKVIAHRGASATHRENTVEAFRAAERQGADGIEFDVRRAGGDVLVVHHDAHLPSGRALIDVTRDELPEWLPTLSETLDVCSGMWVNVEIKNMPDDPDYDAENSISMAVAGLLTAHILGEAGSGDGDEAGVSEEEMFARRVLVSSFNVASLRRMREINPAIPVGLLVWGHVDPATLVARAQAHGVQAIHPQDFLVDRSFVERAHGAGLAVHVWTVDDERRVLELANLGVDGVITNRPDMAHQALVGGGWI